MSDKKLPLILTIDDEKPVRESFRNYLEDYDYEVLEAENGRVGLEVFERRKPDLVLVDLRMPEVDGLEVMASIRGSSPDTPIIVISGAGVIGDVVEALHLGAWDYLLKPIEDLGVLKHAVEAALERARLIRENRTYQEHLEEEVARRTQELERTNEALRESEERFRFFSETSFEGIFLLEKGHVLDVNRRGAEIFGYQLEEMIGKSALELASPESRELVLTHIQTGYERPYEALGLRKDGSTFAGELHSRNMTFKGRSVRVTVVRDITERKQAEQLQDAVYRIAQAADRSPRLDDLFPAIHEIIQSVMPASNFYIALFDEKDDLLSFPFYVDEVDVPPPPAKPGKGMTEFILRTGKSILCDMDLHEEMERRGEVDLVGAPSPIYLGVPLTIDNKTIGVMAVQHYADAKAYGKREQRMLEFVSSQVAKTINHIHSEEVLRESELRYRNLFDNSLNGIALHEIVTDAEGRPVDYIFLGVNQTFEELTGLSADAVTGKRVTAVIPGIENDPFIEIYGQVALTGEPIRFEQFATPLNKHFEIVAFSTRKGQFATVFSDITERKLSEQALRESEERYRSLFENVPVGLYRTTPDGEILDGNRAMLEILGFENREALMAINASEVYSNPEDRQREQALLEHEGVIRGFEVQMRRRDGTEIWVRDTMHAFLDSEGQVAYYEGSMEDITDHKLALEALRFTQFSVDRAAVAAFWMGPDARLFYVNDAACSTLGYSRQELLSMTIHDIDPDYPPEAWLGSWKNIKERGSLTVESRHRTRDGRVFPVEITANYVEFEGKEYNCAFARDITERKHAEEQIQHQLDNLAALHAIDSAITSSVDLTATLQVVLEQITTRLKIDAADVLLFDEHTLMLEYAAGRGFRSASSRSKSLRIGSSYAGSVAIERKMLYIPNIDEDDNAPRIAKTLWLEEGLVTYFGVPLIIKGELKGILELFHRSQLEPDKEWLGFLDTLATQTAIAIDNTILFNDLHRTNLELELAYETTLEGWASALELRDYETKGHSTRVVSMTMQMSERLGISGEELVSLRRGALLHDIGKMGVPDSILLKPGPLTASEWELMKRHPLHGYEMLKSITFLKPSLEIVLSHHERWDGAGYPNGTKGKDIPLPARIFAIVDVWDSLTSDRPYRKAWSREKTLAYIQEQSGTHFDPGMVEAFLNIQELLLTS